MQTTQVATKGGEELGWKCPESGSSPAMRTTFYSDFQLIKPSFSLVIL